MQVAILLTLQVVIFFLVSFFETAQSFVLLPPQERKRSFLISKQRLISRIDTRRVPLDGLAACPAATTAVIDLTMSSEADMPVLKVLTVAEVPTEKADPVDPVARQQAKVCNGRGQRTHTSQIRCNYWCSCLVATCESIISVLACFMCYSYIPL